LSDEDEKASSAPNATGNAAELLAVSPIRLAVATRRTQLPASVRDDAHQRVTERAIDWQAVSGQAVFWEMGAMGRPGGEGRAYALAGQMAAAGEQLALAHAAAVEVAFWRELRQGAEFDTAQEMSMRAMAEAQSLFIIGTGHAIANVALRVLALDQELRAELVEKFTRGGSAPTFAPFSQERADWVSLNTATCKVLQQTAESTGAEEVVQLIEPVTAFGQGRNWRRLVERRGEDFHRWRPQTHGIAGVARASPWKHEGATRRLSGGHPPYEEAEGLADETADLAAAAMLEVTEVMDKFLARWPRASGIIGGPKFVLPESDAGEAG
jgi:hypothetical protein